MRTHTHLLNEKDEGVDTEVVSQDSFLNLCNYIYITPSRGIYSLVKCTVHYRRTVHNRLTVHYRPTLQHRHTRDGTG